MTIISHTHEFIFIKARKVASSSVLVALGRHCSPPDTVILPGDTEGLVIPDFPASGLITHTPPETLKKIVPPEQWERYLKITCVRNPWDAAVSMLLWQYFRRHHKEDKRKRVNFSRQLGQALETRQLDLSDPEYRQKMEDCINWLSINCAFSFDAQNSPNADVYLRYETLQTDYDALCKRLNFPTETLPRLKSQSRAPDWDYRAFFDDDLKARVAGVAHRTINYFDYRF